MSAVFESFPSILFSWYLTFFFWHALFMIWIFYGVRKYLETFWCWFFLFLQPDNLKNKDCNVGSWNKMLGNAMYFVAWYTLPFFRELNLYLYKFKFLLFCLLAPECYWYSVTRTCPFLVDRRRCSRTVFSGRRCWTGGRGRGSVEDPGRLKETSDNFYVSFVFIILFLLFFYFIFSNYFFPLQSWGCRWRRRDGKCRRSSGGGRGRPVRWCGRCSQRRVAVVRHCFRLWWGYRVRCASWWSALASQHGSAS